MAAAGDDGALAAAMLRLLDEEGLWGELVARIPTLPPGLDEHVDAIAKIYEDARAAPPPLQQFPAVAVDRRRAFWQLLRDAEESGRMPPGPPR